ncbi:MAG: hypothetical protein JWR26_1349 [Pedosphaera sp.]|nr:hypothetical protein [Pedosphaera sp.]
MLLNNFYNDMKLPIIQGVIRRRILVNFRVEPGVMQRQLPSKFRPKLLAGAAIGGICLIRLEQIRAKGLPAFMGLSSENAAHRIAVLWEDDQGATREGVFVPRRDTNSILNQMAGGRLFPGEQHAADFRVNGGGERIDLEMKSTDGEVAVRVRGRVAAELSGTSRFGSLTEASNFFEPGSLGYSATGDAGRLDGMVLKTKTWRVEALEVEHVYSSYFGDEKKFPRGSVDFDCALLMRDIEHEWHSAPDLYV